MAERPAKPGADSHSQSTPNNDARPVVNAQRSNGNKSRRSDDSERRSRGPEIVEVTTGRLYVGNLSYDAAESDLINLFNGVGSVESAEVVSHRHTQRSKGYAFVCMTTVDEARRAVEVLHDQDFMGRKLVVSGAKSPGARDSDSGDSSGADYSEDRRSESDEES